MLALCEIGSERVLIDGLAVIDWAKSKTAGLADLRIKLRQEVDSIDHAEALEAYLPGAVSFYDGADGGGGEESEPTNGRLQYDHLPGKYRWVLVGLGEIAPLDAPGLARIEGEAPIASLTLSANKGKTTLTVAIKLSVAVTRIGSVVGLDGQRCRLIGSNGQPDLFKTYADPALPKEAAAASDDLAAREFDAAFTGEPDGDDGDGDGGPDDDLGDDDGDGEPGDADPEDDGISDDDVDVFGDPVPKRGG